MDSCDDNEFENDGKVPISQRMRNRRTNNLNKHRLHVNSPFRNISPNIMTQKQYQSAYNNMRKVNNLDLINDCIESRFEIANQRAVNARRSRSRMLAQHSRHETKFWAIPPSKSLDMCMWEWGSLIIHRFDTVIAESSAGHIKLTIDNFHPWNEGKVCLFLMKSLNETLGEFNIFYYYHRLSP